MDIVTNEVALGRISAGKLLWKSTVRRRNVWIGRIRPYNASRRAVKTDYWRKSIVEDQN